MGKEKVSSSTCSTSQTLQQTPEKTVQQTPEKTLQKRSSTSPRISSLVTSTPPIRPGGYEHPGLISMYQDPIMCVSTMSISKIFSWHVFKHIWIVFLHDCEGVGGQRELSEECDGVGNRGPGGACGGFGGIGAVLKRHAGGKGWRIEKGGDRKGGSGLDSSAES